MIAPVGGGARDASAVAPSPGRPASAGPLRAACAAILRGTLDLLLPRHCAACQEPVGARERGIVCGRCWADLRVLPAPRCDRCGHPTRGRPCRWCALWAPHVRCIRSVAWVPEGTAGRVVHALKYEGWTGVADALAERMARTSWPDDVVEERAALVAVPLAASRLRERGFNQSALLARGLAARWTLPVWDDALVRVRATATQARLTRLERSGNVSGAFQASPGARARLAGRHVVLVDDVVTTAATLSACAAALVAGGARIVSCVTFGRARAHGDRT